jgi:EKC/KEOPS complex subunit PCC1/LAGE3
LTIPFQSDRLSKIALQALQVDQELSPLVERDFEASGSSLIVYYRATTDRMLRVSVNGFMESLGVVLDVMEHLDLVPNSGSSVTK